jgi:hypothetical protein
MKKLYKIKTSEQPDEPKIYCTREINWHNPIVADSIAEAYGYVKDTLDDLEKLKKFEEEGKIKAECGCDSPSFMFVYVLDKSILSEFQKIKLVSPWRRVK